MGSARLLTCLAEVPFFRVSGKILKLLGVSGSIAVAQVAYVLRFLWHLLCTRISLWMCPVSVSLSLSRCLSLCL